MKMIKMIKEELFEKKDNIDDIINIMRNEMPTETNNEGDKKNDVNEEKINEENKNDNEKNEKNNENEIYC